MSGGFEPCYIDGLDAALLTAVLQHLPAPHLARAGCVCRAWATAASNEHLWMAQFDALCTPDYRRNCLPQLSSMVAAAGGWRQLVAWKYDIMCRSRSRLWVECSTQQGGAGFLTVPCAISPAGSVSSSANAGATSAYVGPSDDGSGTNRSRRRPAVDNRGVSPLAGAEHGRENLDSGGTTAMGASSRGGQGSGGSGSVSAGSDGDVVGDSASGCGGAVCSGSTARGGALAVNAGRPKLVPVSGGAGTDSMNHHSTWSPCGAFVAFTLTTRNPAGILGSSLGAAVVIKNYRGDTCARVELRSPFPPFFYTWSPCSTRLAMLSNFHHMQVALRVLEVPLARLVSPGAAAVAPPTVALAGLGVPLFFSWSPDSRFIVQACDGDKCCIVDVDLALAKGPTTVPDPATRVVEVPQRFCDALRAPLWRRNAQGQMLLLLPEVGERLEWPGVQADSGSLVLARLQPPASPGTLPSVALTAKVAEFKGESVGSTVTRDLSAIAYMTQWHTVLACFAAEQYAQTHLIYPPTELEWPQGLPSAMEWGRAVAVQWSPSRHRALVLVLSPELQAPGWGITAVQMRWVIWERLPCGRPALMLCRQHAAPSAYVQSHQSFWDSYNQCSTHWAPGADAFCYTACHHDTDGRGPFKPGPKEFQVFVQPVPTPDITAAFPSAPDKPLLWAAPPPVRVAEGRTVSWSPR